MDKHRREGEGGWRQPIPPSVLINEGRMMWSEVVVCIMAQRRIRKNREGCGMVLSVRDVAELLGCSGQAVYKLTYRRQLPYRKLGGKVIFLKRELEQYLDQLPGLSIRDIE
jgi:excisionase family DNA binding protein